MGPSATCSLVQWVSGEGAALWGFSLFWLACSGEQTPPVDPVDPVTPERVWRVLRGGAWRDAPQGLRASFRFGGHPAGRDDDFGFRCVWRRAPGSLGA